LVVGSNIVAFTKDNIKTAIFLKESEKKDSLDAWLTATLAGVDNLVYAFHSDGLINRIETIKAADLIDDVPSNCFNLA
jgi:hypothetical protein